MEHEEVVGDAAAGATDGEDGKLTAANDGMGDEEELLAVCCDVCKLEDGVMWAMVVHRSSDRVIEVEEGVAVEVETRALRRTCCSCSGAGGRTGGKGEQVVVGVVVGRSLVDPITNIEMQCGDKSADSMCNTCMVR
jgi:hypothetical protein